MRLRTVVLRTWRLKSSTWLTLEPAAFLAEVRFHICRWYRRAKIHDHRDEDKYHRGTPAP